MGNAPGLYDKAVLEVSIKNQIKWRNNVGEGLASGVCVTGGNLCNMIVCVCVQFVMCSEMRGSIMKLCSNTAVSTLW